MTRSDAQALAKGGHSILAHSHMHPFSPAGFEGNKVYEDIIKNSQILSKPWDFSLMVLLTLVESKLKITPQHFSELDTSSL